MLFFKSKAKKQLQEATHLVQMARKVLHYRCDVIGEEAVKAIEGQSAVLSELLNRKNAADHLEKIKEKQQVLDSLLKKHGGTIYPVTAITENVEMLLVAAILAIGIRTFFFQPFKIPTNSMYPTYGGMLPIVYTEENPEPNMIGKAFTFVTKFTSHYELEAPATGKLEVPLSWPSESAYPTRIAQEQRGESKPFQRFFVLPGLVDTYQFRVGGEVAEMEVPYEFDMRLVIQWGYFPEARSFEEAMKTAAEKGMLRRTSANSGVLTVPETIQKGEPALNFDIITGDMLFVDRISYHFIEPNIGAPIVFRTDDITGLMVNGQPDERYYIKRLVGKPGDILRIDEPVLYRNGEPITGSPIFAKEFAQEDEYLGYKNQWWLSDASTVAKLADDYYFAMGDNSANSYDSRGWGYPGTQYQMDALQIRQRINEKRELDEAGTPLNMVPEKSIVGRAVFIFYPITKRWGPAE